MSTPTPTHTHTAVQPLPCPYCGHATAPRLVTSDEMDPDYWDGSNAITFAVMCDASEPGGPGGCGASGGFAPTEAEAVARWSRRASLPAPQGEQRTPGELLRQLDAMGGIGAQAADVIRSLMLVNISGAIQDSRTPTVAPGGQPLPQADSKDDVRWTLVHSLVASKGWMRGYAEAYVDAALSGDSVLPPVEPPGATLSPCAASTAITPAIADALAKARLFVLCALRREGCRFTYHDQPEHWGDRLLEAIEKASSQVDRGESSSEPRG